MFEATTIINVNSLLILESLPSGDAHTGTYLNDDLAAELRQQSVPVGFGTIGSRAAFWKAMDWMRNPQTAGKHRFILHIEAHGAADRSGLAFAPSGDVMPWAEFVDLVREVNRQCLNNLVVVMACCHGFHSILDVSIKDLTPFCTLIGPSEVVTAGLIQQEFPKFYRTLFATNDFNAALGGLDPAFQVYHAEKLLVNSYLGYLRAACRGRGKQKRIDRLLSELKSRRPNVDISKSRRQLKALVRPETGDYEGFKRKFLMSDHADNVGRFPSTLADLVAALEG